MTKRQSNPATMMRHNAKLLFDCYYRLHNEVGYSYHIYLLFNTIHFIIITGQCECFTTPDATLPNTSFLNPESPASPITIRST
jgi:hypothetical protein